MFSGLVMRFSSRAAIIRIEVGSRRTFLSTSSSRRSGSGKPRIVLIGCGWGGTAFLRDIDTNKFAVTCVSQRDHFLLTPLLASTTVGTVEHRSIVEPIRPILYRKGQDNSFVLARAEKVDLANRTLHVNSVLQDVGELASASTAINYDYLVVACGMVPSTFNVPGVREHAFFLKEASDARNVRKRLHDCFEAASLPMSAASPASAAAAAAAGGSSSATSATTKSLEERQRAHEAEVARLLTFVVVGGGPTGVEFSGELHDLLHGEFARLYPHLQGKPRIVLVEASGSVLSVFDITLRQYALSRLRRGGTEVRLSAAVKEVGKDYVLLSSGERLPCGLVVWSTGVGPRSFVKSSALAVNARGSHIAVDESLRVLNGQGRVFAMGDTASIEHPVRTPLPAIAQVAEQQGAFLAEAFNSGFVQQWADKPVIPAPAAAAAAGAGAGAGATPAEASGATAAAASASPSTAATATAATSSAASASRPFAFHSAGMLAYLGGYKGVADLVAAQPSASSGASKPQAQQQQDDAAVKDPLHVRMKGFLAWSTWRLAYLSKCGTWRNRFSVPFDWFKTFFFGRDISSF